MKAVLGLIYISLVLASSLAGKSCLTTIAPLFFSLINFTNIRSVFLYFFPLVKVGMEIKFIKRIIP